MCHRFHTNRTARIRPASRTSNNVFEMCLLAVRKEDVRLIFRELDPDGVAAKLSRRLERRTYTVPGPNFIWHLDGYDKLRLSDLA